MPRSTVVWDDFSGGDEGRTRPPKGKSNTFRGVNVWQYPSGIGPRPRLNGGAVITGLPTGVPHAVIPISNGSVIVIMGAVSPYTIYRVDGAVATSIGTMTNIPTDWVVSGTAILVCSSAGAGVIIASGTTVVALAAMPAANRIEIFGVHALVMSTNVLRWSAPLDGTTWPAVNTVQIGLTSESIVEDVVCQRGRLVVLNALGEIWAVSGTLGTNETYSRVDVVGVPRRGNTSNNSARPHGVLARQGGYWFPLDTAKYLANFTGARAYLVMTPDMAMDGLTENTAMAFEAMAGLSDTDCFIGASIASATVLLSAYIGEAWTRHRFPTSEVITGLTPQVFISTAPGEALPDSVVVVSASASTVPRMYSLSAASDFPSSSFDGQSGTQVVADFRTGEVWDDEGGDISVQSVIVDYSFVNAAISGSTPGTPTFTISVESTQPHKDTLVDPSATHVFTPPATVNPESSAGEAQYRSRGRASFQFGDQQAAAGFRIKIANWQSIMIHRITAVIDTTPAVY